MKGSIYIVAEKDGSAVGAANTRALSASEIKICVFVAQVGDTVSERFDLGAVPVLSSDWNTESRLNLKPLLACVRATYGCIGHLVTRDQSGVIVES